MPYSNDLRLRVLAAVDGGVPVRQVAALLRVSVSYIYKALIRRRRTGETAARMPCGRPPRNLASHEQALLTRLGAEPDATLAELRDWLAAERPVPYGHWKTTTFVAGLRCDGLTAPFVIDGPINGEWFRTYVEKVLAPTLRPGDIVILDNLGAHKVAGVRAAVEARGARLLYLPPYSPDLNPIEQLFAKLKALLRKAAARTVEALWTAVATLLTAFSTDECANYFANAGYRRS
jgi:transposase